MTTNRDVTMLETVIASTAVLDLAGPEIANLRTHLYAAAMDETPAGAYTAARSAEILANAFARVAGALRDQAARDSISYGSPSTSTA